MFRYDKDMERVMQAKKREIVNELEELKLRIMNELSGVDKITLTKLRQIMDDYNHIDYNITTKINAIQTEIDTFIKSSDDDYNNMVDTFNGLKSELEEYKTKTSTDLTTYIDNELSNINVSGDTSEIERKITNLQDDVDRHTTSIENLEAFKDDYETDKEELTEAINNKKYLDIAEIKMTQEDVTTLGYLATASMTYKMSVNCDNFSGQSQYADYKIMGLLKFEPYNDGEVLTGHSIDNEKGEITLHFINVSEDNEVDVGYEEITVLVYKYLEGDE